MSGLTTARCLTALFLVLSIVAVAAADPIVPNFGVTTADGRFYNYVGSHVENQNVVADIVSLGDDRWRLILRPQVALSVVYFPWNDERWPLDSDSSDDLIYYPYLSGVTERVSLRPGAYSMFGFTYPGGVFAPLTVMADRDDGIIVAATNWPPRKVAPMFTGQRMTLKYERALAAGSSDTFDALVSRVRGDPNRGKVPWQLALDKYRRWLDSVIPPVVYPSWLANIQGWIQVGLYNEQSDEVSEIRALWEESKAYFPWMQFWGQMGGGCCVLNQTMSSRFAGLDTFVRQEIAKGAGAVHMGYYSAPYYSDPQNKALDTLAGYTWFSGWITKNRVTYGANAYYYDTLGGMYYGDPLLIRNYFLNKNFPADAVMEKLVDIYPAAYLMSGSLIGNKDYPGGIGKLPENSVTTTFPGFGRYLLGDRIVFEGYANDDYKLWGAAHSNWSERQAFLLGAKFDVPTIHDPPNGGPFNVALNLALEERNSSGWWWRQPVYQDTRGLTQIPAGIDVRRFRDKYKGTLLAIDNWGQLNGKQVMVDGQAVSIPTRKLSVVNVNFLADFNHDGCVDAGDYTMWADDPSLCDLDHDGVVDPGEQTIIMDALGQGNCVR